MNEAKRCVILGLVVFYASGLYAARPFSTDDAGTVERGVHELEFGCDFWSDEAALGVGFKHGLTDRMDLGVGFGHGIAPEEIAGFENAELCLKFAFIPDLFAASITGSFGHAAYVLNGIVTHNLGPIEIDGNFGYETGGIAGEDGTIIYALAFLFNIGSYAIGIEGAGDKDRLQTWLVGGRYALFDGLAVDAGISGGFEEDAALIAAAGIHYES